MSWRDRLRPASFRGAAFLVDAHDGGVGRRPAVHEYPQREKWFIEDMGRAVRTFDIAAYVIGEDYFPARDALLKACEEPGPGKLVHPYLGEFNAFCVEAHVSESNDERRIARFTLRLLEAGEQIYPTVTPDTKSITLGKADKLLARMAASFASRFNIGGVIDFVATRAEEHLGVALDAVSSLAGFTTSASSFASRLQGLRDDGAALLSTPLDLAEEFGLLVGEASRIEPLRPLMSFSFKAPPSLVRTATRVQHQANEVAMNAMVRQAALAQAGTVVAEAAFETHDDAVRVREELAERLSDEAAAVDDDELYVALFEMRSAVVADITRRALDLPRLKVIRLAEMEPSLVTAYRLYADTERSREIEDRNAIVHPGFIHADEPLLVLNR